MDTQQPDVNPTRWSEQSMPHETSARPAPRGMMGLAWVVIVLMCLMTLVIHAADLRKQPSTAPQIASENPIEAMLMELQGKYIVGAAEVSPQNAVLIESLERALNVGSVNQRQKFIVLVGELLGPDKALSRLDDLDELIEAEQQSNQSDQPLLSPDDQRVQAALRELFEQKAARESENETATEQSAPGEVNSEPASDQLASGAQARSEDSVDIALLVKRLGWFGELAVAEAATENPAARAQAIAPASRLFYFIIGVAVLGGLAGFAGFAGLIAVGVMAIIGKLRSRVQASGTNHALYAETFALWMVLFLGLQVLASWVSSFVPDMALPIVFVAFMTSMLALAWPVMRGVPWAQVKRDIGWHSGRSTVVEIAVGVGSYFMALPVLAVGVAITYVLMILQQALKPAGPIFQPPGGPAHPIIEQLTGPDWFPKIMVLALGAIAAPIVEETMFRGVLYGHLRGATRAWGILLSILFGTIVNSFIFAAVHPQGWVAIPALMSLAIAFSLVREWRGSILPPMIMHGMSNFIVMSLLITALSM